MSRPQCVHHFQTGSTVELEYVEETGTWSARCTVCRRYTSPCLTRAEASARVLREWWSM